MGILKKNRRFIVMAAISALILFWAAVASFPATAAPHTSAGFYVRANIPENQITKGLSYFDLCMQPRQVQQLAVEITNEFGTPISVDVEAISASTNRNGIIDYKTPAIQDETLRVPFSSISVVEEPTLSVPARSTKIVRITVTMPEEPFDGAILGGLVFTRVLEDEEVSQTGSVNNVFSYVIGVKLSENDAEVLPNFEIVKIAPETVNYRPVFVHTIRNTEALIVKNMDIEVSIKDARGVIQAMASKQNVDMAPNSIMPLGIDPGNGQIKPGEYISDIQIEYDGQVFSYRIPFSVAGAEAERVNTESIGDKPTEDNTYKTVAHTVLVLQFVLIVVLIFLPSLIKRRKEKKENQQIKQNDE